MKWLDKKFRSETVRQIAFQIAAIVVVAIVVSLIWNRWISEDRIPLVRRAVPTPVPTVASDVFSSPEEIPEAKSYHIVDVTEAYEMFVTGSAVFVDARLKEEHDEGHIPGSILLPSEQFDIYYPKVQHMLPLEQPLVIYCIGEDCALSVELCLFLLDTGYENVYLFEGGWPKWQNAGLPEEKPQEMELRESTEAIDEATP